MRMGVVKLAILFVLDELLEGCGADHSNEIERICARATTNVIYSYII